MTAKLTRLTQKIVIQLHLVAESRAICISRSRQPVRKLLDTHSYVARNIEALDLSITQQLFVLRVALRFSCEVG